MKTTERKAFEQWLGIAPKGAAHDLAWAAWKAHAALTAAPTPPAQPAVPEDVARVNQQMLEALKASRAYIARYGYTGKQLEIIDAAIDAARAAEKGGA